MNLVHKVIALFLLVAICIPLNLRGGEITITLAGDFGFNGSKAVPDSCGGYCPESKRYLEYHEMTAGIEHLFTSDLNIVNLETTVLETLPNPGLPRKSYLFSTHPAGVNHMDQRQS